MFVANVSPVRLARSLRHGSICATPKDMMTSRANVFLAGLFVGVLGGSGVSFQAPVSGAGMARLFGIGALHEFLDGSRHFGSVKERLVRAQRHVERPRARHQPE